MAYRSSTQLLGGDRSSIAIPVPTGAAAGDIAVVAMSVSSANTITPPAGFTLKYDSTLIINIRLVVFWKRLTAADSGTWTFTTPTAQWIRAVAGLWSGRLGSGDPFTAAAGTPPSSGSATVTVASITAAAGDDLVGAAACFNDATWTPPAGMTERRDPGEGVTLASQDALSAGATGTKTFTASSSSGISGWIGALAVAGSSSVTGTGATSAAAATATGTGSASTTGTGSTSATAGTAQGAGSSAITGQGSTSAVAGVTSVTGTSATTGSGSATAPDGVAAGVSGTPPPATGSGVASGDAAQVSGAGTSTVTGSGSVVVGAGVAFGMQPPPTRDVTVVSIVTHPQRTVTVTESTRALTVVEHVRVVTIEES